MYDLLIFLGGIFVGTVFGMCMFALFSVGRGDDT